MSLRAKGQHRSGRVGEALSSKAYLNKTHQISVTCPAQARSLAEGCAVMHLTVPDGAISIKTETGLYH
ncbi:MAG: hypothetical protein KAS67_03785 [Thermoplasmata archaeon]|nr:hypothetical protein [Thermoplasmata archaeon]